VKEDHKTGKGAESIFVYATKSQRTIRQSQRLSATLSCNKIAGGDRS